MLLPKPLKYAAIGGGVFVFGILIGWVIFPVILKSQIKKEMALSKKTDLRQMWEKVPFALDFKVYIFNYTNVDEIQKGAKPIVKEIGPYYFEEWKEKVEVEDHEENDTITYKRLDVFHFRPDLSGPGLTGEEVIIMPHLFILAMVATINREKPSMLNVVEKSINGIFDNPKDVFLRVKAMDIMFRGIIINCDRTEFAPKAACTKMKKDAVTGVIYEPNNQFRFSLFGTRNNTVNPDVVTVKRGIKNIMDVGQVVALNGKPQIDIWRDHCNEFQGTDGTVFPPFLTYKDRLQSFSFDLCRSFKAWFQKKTSYKGIKTNRYIANVGDFANDPELQCFCDTPDECLPKGIMDIRKCLKVPMYVSLPHFLETDTSVTNQVKGLTPDPNEHGIIADFEPLSGTLMDAKQRMQYNIKLLRTDKIAIFKDLPDSIVPCFWVHEGILLNKTFVKMLKHQLFIPKRIVGVIRWWMVSFGLIAVLAGVMYHFKDNIMGWAAKGESTTAKVNPEDGSNEQRGVSVIGQDREPPKVTM
uniref:Sensory neuron membrane protein 1 n=1 Tax=Antheraea polyphemus TaxID=7120 RepID=SNMP1_ANTPO|nr:RecName: Full=Sensory neuron membrane protein 1 [Antheraea polyphemus]AAC47540.1 sensory neuron membrane protein-1 [Antheraea polyphemus]